MPMPSWRYLAASISAAALGASIVELGWLTVEVGAGLVGLFVGWLLNMMWEDMKK